ncbi:MAG: hypothetical protein ACKVZJ_04630 [Phycisphaerales bacterium]
MAFSFFGKKKDDPEAAKAAGTGGGAADGTTGKPPGGDDDAASSAGFTPDPRKAQAFFTHAQTIQETENFEYATTLWLQGLRMDPTSMRGHEGFYACASAFGDRSGNKGPSKTQAGALPTKSDVDKYVNALLNWGTRPMDWPFGLKAFEYAAKLDLPEPGYWLGSKVLAAAVSDQKRLKKDHLVQMMELFSKISAFDRAVQAGDVAARMDPSDSALIAKLRNMSAQATMNRGGYEQTGNQGGFRQNVKNIDAQRAKEEEERIVKSEDVQVRAIANAAEEYKARPTDAATISKYARLLRERGTPEDEKLAYQVLMKGFEITKTYKFKQDAGDIKMRVGRRKLRELKAALDAEPGNDERKSQFESAARKVLEGEIAEYTERVAAYPTDLAMKFELGRRLGEIGDHEKAIEQYQVAQNAPGIGNTVLAHLGASFSALGWLDEAEGTYKRALEKHEAQNDELALSLRYGLMDVMQRKAADSRDLNNAEEAFKLASAIAIQQINYRDIRARREQLQALVKELRTAR